MSETFSSLGIGPAFVDALTQHGIVEPSPVQREAIPAVLAGSDMLVQSQTGTGKTLAYLLPILQAIDPAAKDLQAIVLSPTRELGVQIAAEVEKYGAPAGIRGQALIGGASMSRQIDRLKLHPHIVVGTPGRIAELLRLRKVKLHRVRTIVIDEADQMFALGAAKEAEEIVESALRDRQLLFFSATLPAEVRGMANRWMKAPKVIEINPGQRTAGGIEHLVFVCEEREKIDTLRKLIRLYEPRSALAFVNDLDIIAEVAAKLAHAGINAAALYGDAPKQVRTTLLNRFRSGKLNTLVATDVAARGLDIDGLTHVFHVQPALDAEHYVHRAGRTGRMGRSGLSVSIVTEQELFIIRKFEKQLGITFAHKSMFKGKIVDAGEQRAPVGGGIAAIRQSKGGFRTMGAASLRNEREKLTGKPAQRPSEPAAAKSVKAAEPPPKPKAKPKESARDRKNKGAPRWLKQKAEQSAGAGEAPLKSPKP